MIANTIILDNDITVEVNAFDESCKDAIIKRVIELSSKNTILDEMTTNYSAEGGFELPLTSEWHDAIRTQNRNAYQYIDYHNSREFRFNYGSHQINKLYTKNGMKWWTTEEKKLFREVINMASSKINDLWD